MRSSHCLPRTFASGLFEWVCACVSCYAWPPFIMAKYPKGFLCVFLATVKHTESARVNKAGLGAKRNRGRLSQIRRSRRWWPCVNLMGKASCWWEWLVIYLTHHLKCPTYPWNACAHRLHMEKGRPLKSSWINGAPAGGGADQTARFNMWHSTAVLFLRLSLRKRQILQRLLAAARLQLQFVLV